MCWCEKVVLEGTTTHYVVDVATAAAAAALSLLNWIHSACSSTPFFSSSQKQYVSLPVMAESFWENWLDMTRCRIWYSMMPRNEYTVLNQHQKRWNWACMSFEGTMCAWLQTMMNPNGQMILCHHCRQYSNKRRYEILMLVVSIVITVIECHLM